MQKASKSKQFLIYQPQMLCGNLLEPGCIDALTKFDTLTWLVSLDEEDVEHPTAIPSA